MFDINSIPMSERVHITKNLLRYGIAVDQETGKIDYIPGTKVPPVSLFAGTTLNSLPVFLQ